MSSKYLTIISVSMILLFVYGTAYAVASPNNVNPQADKWVQQEEKLHEKLKGDQTTEEGRSKVCNNVQSRVTERWDNYYNRRMLKVENTGKGITTLESRVAFYKGKGLDTSNLESDIATLKSLVDQYKTAYTRFLNLLQDAKTVPCANYEGKFLPKLKLAKDQWVVVKQYADSVRDFYQNNVKKDLQAFETEDIVAK